jgi:hypothetical protein
MSDSAVPDYLQAEFDPSFLFVPRLRSILVSHNIPYLSNAKKPELIEIFTKKVLPLSGKIIASSKAKRSSRGIRNASPVPISNPATEDTETNTLRIDAEQDPRRNSEVMRSSKGIKHANPVHAEQQGLRRSSRKSNPPDRFGFSCA